MIRYTSAPTEYDRANRGTLCTVFLNDEGTLKELYIQTDRNEERPSWIKVSDMFLKVYEKKLEDISFIQECLIEFDKIVRP